MSAGRFEEAFLELLLVEGFYSNDPVDAGGETIYGVSRRANPDWPGWAIVDAARGRASFPESLRTDRELRRLAGELYRVRYWDPVRADELPARVGENLFDVAVNAGAQTAVELLQCALVALDVAGVVIDGKLGPGTVAAAQRYAREPDRLLDTFQAALAGYYKGLMTARPSQRKYRRGWLNRALTDSSETTRVEVAP